MTETGLKTAVTDAPQSIRQSVSTKRLIFVVAGVLLGLLLAALDQTIIGTAMPHVVADLGGMEHYAWVFTAYMLASTVSVPIHGKLSDIYGRRVFFLGGMIVFMLGSALSGLSQTMVQLILFRALQGLGAGALLPLAFAIIGDIFPPAERGKWQGLISGVFGLASIVGPTLGGWLTDNWGWPWVFYVNMPVGVLAIVTTGLALPSHRSYRARTIDYAGVATLVAGAVPLLLAFSWAGTAYPWGSPQIVGLLGFAVAVLGVFIIIETRAHEPIINPSLFGNGIFLVSVVASFLISVGMFGTIMYLPLFIQAVLGNSATNAGAVLTPMMLGFVVSSIIGGQIMSRTGRYKLLGLVSIALAIAGMFLLSRMDVDTSNSTVIRNMILTGLGVGTTMSLFTIAVQNAFPFQRLGEVTAGLQFFRSIGGTIGVALLGSVMTNRFQAAFDAHVPAPLQEAIPPAQLAQLRDPQTLLAPEAATDLQQRFAAVGDQELLNQLMRVIRESLAGAITDLFLVGSVMLILALLVMTFLREIPLRKGFGERVAQPTEALRTREGMAE